MSNLIDNTAPSRVGTGLPAEVGTGLPAEVGSYDQTRYNFGMASAISVRLDDEALRALGQLEASGLSRSEAIRKALVDSAARLHTRRALAEEVAALEADEGDRREMQEIAAFMENLRAPG